MTKKPKAKRKTKAKTKPMSLRAYARRRGVSVEAVSKAIASGRLSSSVVYVNGQPKIADPELADREWEANTRPRIDHPASASEAERTVAEVLEGSTPSDIPDYKISRSLREAAAARREAALADMAEIDVLERRGKLVPADKARADMINDYTIVKTKLLSLPSRARQRLQHLTAADVDVLDELIREDLEALSVDGDQDEEPDDEA